jgi:hypothetical protein
MLKLFENRVINTINKLAVSIEDIKGGRFGGEDKRRDGGGGAGIDGAGMTHDVMSVLTDQHNSLLLVLAAQTQKLDNLEHVCLHRTRSDEHRECSCGGEPPRSEFAPKIEEILQTVGNLKERLADAEADLEEEKSRVKALQGELRSAQQALDEGARELRSRENEMDRFQAHLRMHTLYQQPFSAEATDGMREGTPTVLHLQAELVQMSNHTEERGRERDTERPRVSRSRARSSLSLRSDMTDKPRSEQRNRIIQEINLFREGGGVSQMPRKSLVPSDISDQSRSDQYNRLIQDINLFLKPEADEGDGGGAGVLGVRSGADKASPDQFARRSSGDFTTKTCSSPRTHHLQRDQTILLMGRDM